MDFSQFRITPGNPFSLCFVCLGNICRSPTAEGIFRQMISDGDLDSYFEIDSAGTSAYHIGESANSKSQMVARRHGVTLHSTARQFEASDLEYYNLILTMDQENLQNIHRMNGADRHTDKIVMMRDFDPQTDGREDVPDPYYGGDQGFERVFEVLERSCKNLLDQLQERIEDPTTI